jgi:hypothetical protein
MARPVTAAPRTLATLSPGETARIASFDYDAVRGLCGDLGIREGELIRCRAGTGGMLVLDTADGRTLSLARDWARYIRVALDAAAETDSGFLPRA